MTSACQLFKRFARRTGEATQRVGAGVAAIQDGQLLLIRRRDDGLWDLPGEGVQAGERVEEAARRELQEETRLSGGTLTLLNVFSGPEQRHTYPDGNVVDWVTVLFVSQDAQGEARAADDAAEVRWWPVNDLPADVSTATSHYFAALRGARP